MKECKMITLEPDEAKALGLEIIKAQPVCDFTTIDDEGFPQTRKMWAAGMDEDLTMYYATGKESIKCKQLAKNDKINLSWQKNIEDMEKWEQTQIKAIAVVTEDQALKDRFWNDMMAEHFESKDNPNYVIIIVQPQTMLYQKMNIYPPVEIILSSFS